jgi:transposase-like protein
VLVHVPKRSQAEVSEAMKAVFVQRDEKSAKAKAADLVRQFQARFAKAMEIFEAGIDDVLSYLHYPQPHRTRISSTNPLERLNLEIRRRTRVVGIHPEGVARTPGKFMESVRTGKIRDNVSQSSAGSF